MTNQKVLIVGAGVAGRELIKEINKHKNLRISVVGFIDDDEIKHGKKLAGISILGSRRILKQTIRDLNVDKVFIALPSVDGEIISEILKLCIEVGIPCQTIPRVREIIEGKVDLKRIRDVQIADLLDRPIRKPDVAEVTHLLKDKVLMVTGAAGSIGSELCRQIASYSPKLIVMYDWWENGLYDLEVEFKENFKDCRIILVPGNIQDKSHVESTLETYHPSIIFHAAAYKHVPMMEDNASEAVKNNVFGTYNLVECAGKIEIDKFVFISTDKAVNPKSIMGMTKLMGECITTSLFKNPKTVYTCVRFGNVMNSAGSVLPLFRKQLPSGTITVTDKKMTRFFMTIEEAVQLILKATMLGKKNEIFVLDMGKPIKIIDIAKKFILLSGLIPDKDVTIKYIGSRPGEKMSEELATKSENVSKTKFEKIYVLKKKILPISNLKNTLGSLEESCEKQDDEKTQSILRSFVRMYAKYE